MSYFKKLVGTRCYLSPLDPADAGRYTEWLNDPEVAIHLQVAPQVISLPREREILERLSREERVFAIVDLATDQLLGNCSLARIDVVNRTAELGILIGDKRFWNQGYGEEATRLTLDFAFNFLNLNNVMLQVYAYNQRAIRCYRKCGFREIGRRRQARLVGRKAWDILFMDALAGEFGASVLDPLLPAG